MTYRTALPFLAALAVGCASLPICSDLAPDRERVEERIAEAQALVEIACVLRPDDRCGEAREILAGLRDVLDRLDRICAERRGEGAVGVRVEIRALERRLQALAARAGAKAAAAVPAAERWFQVRAADLVPAAGSEEIIYEPEICAPETEYDAWRVALYEQTWEAGVGEVVADRRRSWARVVDDSLPGRMSLRQARDSARDLAAYHWGRCSVASASCYQMQARERWYTVCRGDAFVRGLWLLVQRAHTRYEQH